MTYVMRYKQDNRLRGTTYCLGRFCSKNARDGCRLRACCMSLQETYLAANQLRAYMQGFIWHGVARLILLG